VRDIRPTFSHILPVVDLALLVLLVFVPITTTALHLYQAADGSDQVHLHDGQFDLTIPRDQIVLWAIRIATVRAAHTIKAINLPGTIFDVLISLPTSWPSTWHPQALLLETWDALVYPFYCLPFWWLVGCGLDGIFRKERLHWSLFLIGTLLSVLCLVVALGIRFGQPARERFDLAWVIWGLAAWTIAFATLPIAWIMQSVRRGHADQQQPHSS
jgi:hypothetical protein